MKIIRNPLTSRRGEFVDFTEEQPKRMLNKREKEKLFSKIRREEAKEKALRQERSVKGRFTRGSTNLGRSVGRFGQAAQQPIDFTPEQEALQQMFGGGEKIWGVNNEPVRINHDLNPSQRGDEGTSNLFGFGNERRRSGLF